MVEAFDCLCAGIIVADTVCQPIARMPSPGDLICTDRVELTIGGCAANVAADMGRLGMKVSISARVGDDLFGREVRNRLQAASVETSGLETSGTSPTSFTFVLNVRGEDRRFIHCVGANAEYDGRQIPEERIRAAKVLYVGGFGLLASLTPECVVRLFKIARAAKVATILNVVLSDSENIGPWMQEVLPWTDYFFPNNDEAERLCGETDPLQQARRLKEWGAKTVVVTCGSRGAVVDGPEGRFSAGVYPVEAVDGTGTGDAFVSGFVYGLLQHAPVEECLRLGTGMGASCVQSMGATTGVFTAQELTEFVKAHPLEIVRR